MTIVDTTVWVDYLRGIATPQTDWLDANLLIERLGVTDLILCEVLQGVSDEDRARQVQRELLKFEVFTPGGVRLAIRAGQNYRTLRRGGYKARKTIACLIATFCLLNGHSLLHDNRDFDPFEKVLGLKVVAT